jgi:hypothetical protein
LATGGRRYEPEEDEMKRMMKTMIVAALLVPAGCGSDPVAPLDPFQPQINSSTDDFQLQATDVKNVATTLKYSWENTGAQAVVDHSTTTAKGSAKVVITDAAGVVVYEHGLEPSLNVDTAAGVAGTWTITLVLTDYSGTLNFRVQRKT